MYRGRGKKELEKTQSDESQLEMLVTISCVSAPTVMVIPTEGEAGQDELLHSKFIYRVIIEAHITALYKADRDILNAARNYRHGSKRCHTRRNL